MLFDLSGNKTKTYLINQKTFKFEYTKMIDGENVTQYSKASSALIEYISIRQNPDTTVHRTLQYEIKPRSYADTIWKQLTKAGFEFISGQNNFGMLSLHYVKGHCEIAVIRFDSEPFASIELSERNPER